jgi:hypothetical protein
MTGQLHLFKGKRQTGVKPRGPTEFQIHCAVMDCLRNGIAPGWRAWHTPNGEYRMQATGGKLQRMGTMPGVSDILLAGPPHATLHALELKAKGEKPTESQEAFLAWVEAIGGKADCADSVDGALAILRSWGAVRTRL